MLIDGSNPSLWTPADVAEVADAEGSNPSEENRAGSSPVIGTTGYGGIGRHASFRVMLVK